MSRRPVYRREGGTGGLFHVFVITKVWKRHFLGGRRRRLRKAEAISRPMKMLKERE